MSTKTLKPINPTKGEIIENLRLGGFSVTEAEEITKKFRRLDPKALLGRKRP